MLAMVILIQVAVAQDPTSTTTELTTTTPELTTTTPEMTTTTPEETTTTPEETTTTPEMTTTTPEETTTTPEMTTTTPEMTTTTPEVTTTTWITTTDDITTTAGGGCPAGFTGDNCLVGESTASSPLRMRRCAREYVFRVFFRIKTRKPCCRRESARCRCNFRSIDQEHDK